MSATATRRKSDTISDSINQCGTGIPLMRWHTSSASSSSAGIADDIFRLIPPNERSAFREMLEIEFHDRELSDHEKRRAAERMWHRFLKHGWPA
jgi:hypothetical protein